MKERKERVLMVHNFYQIGGGEHTVFENEKRLLIENGHHLVEYTRDNAELKKSVVKKLLLPFSTVFSLKTYHDVRKIIKKEKIDIVHCHNTFPLISPAVYYAAWSCNVPVVQTIHNFRFMCPNGIFFSDGTVCEDCIHKGLGCSIKKGCYRNSKIQTAVVANMLTIHRMLGTYKKLRYIFLTDFNRTKFKRLLRSNCDNEFVKPNFEYINAFSDDTERDDSFIFIGRLDGYKGIPFLISAWNNIQKDLYVFGDGEYKNAVIQAQKQNPYIHYMGFRQQSEIFYYLKRAKALIFPSELYEGFPMTLIESFSFGTPVICSDIGNGADIIRKANAGIVFSLGDKYGFQNAITQIDEVFDNLSRKARQAYQNHFTPEANYKELKRIYEKVISEYEQ